MTKPRVAVVKVGGSLLDWPELPGRLSVFVEARRALEPEEWTILIAGGGAAADLVRTLDRVHRLGDTTAHQLALQALSFTAQVLAALLPGALPIDRLEDLNPAWIEGWVPILDPRPILRQIERSGADPLPRSWDVTSDTIAARIAAHLGADRLILLKSTALPCGTSREEAVRRGWVDPMFPHVARTLPRVEYLNLRDPIALLVAF